MTALSHTHTHTHRVRIRRPYRICILHKYAHNFGCPAQCQQTYSDDQRPSDHKRPPPSPFRSRVIRNHANDRLHYESGERSSNPHHRCTALCQTELEEVGRAVCRALSDAHVCKVMFDSRTSHFYTPGQSVECKPRSCIHRSCSLLYAHQTESQKGHSHRLCRAFDKWHACP